MIAYLRWAALCVGSFGGRVGYQACRKLGVTEQTYYRWRKEYGGVRTDQVKRFKELE